jgi:hypothetical protein
VKETALSKRKMTIAKTYNRFPTLLLYISGSGVLSQPDIIEHPQQCNVNIHQILVKRYMTASYKSEKDMYYNTRIEIVALS